MTGTAESAELGEGDGDGPGEGDGEGAGGGGCCGQKGATEAGMEKKTEGEEGGVPEKHTETLRIVWRPSVTSLGNTKRAPAA